MKAKTTTTARIYFERCIGRWTVEVVKHPLNAVICTERFEHRDDAVTFATEEFPKAVINVT